MNVYFDGAFFNFLKDGERPKRNEQVASYGIVIDADETQLELMGAVKGNYQLNGLHELLAFGEAVLWLSSHQVKPEEVAFYGDDQTSIYGALSYNSGWSNDAHYRCLVDGMAKLVKLGHMPTDIMEKVHVYIAGSRFHKVKGHKLCVNNNRCDYLAKTAGRRLLQVKHKFLDFERWLALGFSCWSHEENKSVPFHPPTFAAAH